MVDIRRLKICRRLFLLHLLLAMAAAISHPQQAESLRKTADDNDRQFTNVGNIAVTISNFGTIGTRNRYWPNQPSCEYPKGSRIEHIYQGGLWVGARSRRSGFRLVSTGVTDRSGSAGEGYEYTSELGSTIQSRSTIPESRYFSQDAVSHQDFVAEYSDRNTRVPATGDSILNHEPLGISVRQESYAWNFPFADFFVIIRYVVTNSGTDTLENVYLGIWNNAVVRNTNAVRPGTSGYFDRGGNGYDSLARAMYTFEFDPTPGGVPADSYVALKLLGVTPFPSSVDSLGDLFRKTYYNAWRFRGSSGEIEYFSPTDDFHANQYLSRYTRMTQSIPQNRIAQLRLAPYNMTTLLSTGPFHLLPPGETVEMVIAVVCAKKTGTEPERFDTPEQRRGLVTNMSWAQQTYDGEDLNGNNRLDPEEDLNANGVLDRYQLPSPPRQPKVRTVVGNQRVDVYWDSGAESSVDPITKQTDFEGYRIYRSTPGADFLTSESLLLSLGLVGEFDLPGNGVGYNTGFQSIRLSEPVRFPGDATDYWYRFPPSGLELTHLNGWQYVYGVSAFDRGDPVNNLPILESAPVIARVVPGTAPEGRDAQPVRVYPNPYYARAYWDGPGERTRKIYFCNLPSRCTISVFTIAGDVVAQLEHDAATYDGMEIEWFRRYSDTERPPQFAGGEHAWDLISRYDQAIASGLYLFSVRDHESGDITTGKFMIIK
jgi:hypothetical protein